ncbi:hypothetical protein IMG5_098630 [Ichthyophthirius multifiliis]|uniref:Transmembrane protein n=1 Tax=Ichthyophthirius multifiliis TaxID=5932 RepID=G0QRZ7_ICHMU|nr:hypothetical protein IMG5_098630 [Ichthyophthirius multifiliis]EGR32027.1 hypothetical protein IMG5_098630 [Ichthyophthirius multifiliis]|eukprot:XP_004035513.1 hypothetical protein IMG5_098630 [Ichthyophthirius multifiliis]
MYFLFFIYKINKLQNFFYLIKIQNNFQKQYLYVPIISSFIIANSQYVLYIFLQQKKIVNQYKNEWSYLQDLQLKNKTNIFKINNSQNSTLKIDTGKILQIQYNSINKLYIKIKNQIKDQEYNNNYIRKQNQNIIVFLKKKKKKKLMQDYHNKRQQQNEIQNKNCLSFNHNLIEQKRENQIKEKEYDKILFEQNQKKAQLEEEKMRNIQKQEKEFVKNELLLKNQTQEDIKKMQQISMNERNKLLGQQEYQKIVQQDEKRKQFLDNLKQKCSLRYQNPVQNVFEELYKQNIENRQNFERKFVDEPQQQKLKKQQEMLENQFYQNQKAKKDINDTLKLQIAIKQDIQHQQEQEKHNYQQFLNQKDQEGLEHDNQIKKYQYDQKKEYTINLLNQVYIKYYYYFNKYILIQKFKKRCSKNTKEIMII